MMPKRVLIVHGWLHSAEIYKRLKRDLERRGVIVTIYELPGFGDTKPCAYSNLLSTYADKVKELLQTEKYLSKVRRWVMFNFESPEHQAEIQKLAEATVYDEDTIGCFLVCYGDNQKCGAFQTSGCKEAAKCGRLSGVQARLRRVEVS